MKTRRELAEDGGAGAEPPASSVRPATNGVARLKSENELAMVLGHFVGLRARNFTSMKSVGAALGLLFFHNTVHLYPLVFDSLCSKAWVNYVVTHTEAHSMVWRGISFVF